MVTIRSRGRHARPPYLSPDAKTPYYQTWSVPCETEQPRSPSPRRSPSGGCRLYGVRRRRITTTATTRQHQGIQLGPRPFYLVDGMDEGPLKNKLQPVQERAVLAHRLLHRPPRRRPAVPRAHEGVLRRRRRAWAPGIVECDVTFTRDGELVCRHSECDLHTTTNIVATELNAKCSVPWSGPNSNPKCCTSDLTLAEFKSLQGKMDASVPRATTAAGLSGRHRLLAHRPLHRPRHAGDAARERGPEREERRQAHARAEGRRSRAHRPGLRRPGPVRPEG